MWLPYPQQSEIVARLRIERYAEAYKSESISEPLLADFDPAAAEPLSGQTTYSGDDHVVVIGHQNSDIWDIHPVDCWSRLDLATGNYSYYNGGDVYYDFPSDYEPRTPYEMWLDGSGSEPTENSDYVELPPDYVYPSNPYSGDTWLSAFAGQRGDGFDQGINFAAGFADNLSFNLTLAWRDRVWGTDTVDYDGTAYSAGGWAATAV